MTTTSLWGGRCPSFSSLVALGLITLAGTPLVAAAQEVVPKAGDRVRVTVRVPSYNKDLRYVGNLGGWDEAALRWESAGSPQSAPLDRVTKLELSRGTKSNAGKGALIGGAVGLGAGLIAGAVLSGFCGNDLNTDNAECRVRGTLFGGGVLALLGAGVGALVGTASKSERWSAVPGSVYGVTP